MIPGTRPSRRSARAAPLPARERVAALIRLTLAIGYPRLKPCPQREIPRQPPGVPVKPRMAALITSQVLENKKCRNGRLGSVSERKTSSGGLGVARQTGAYLAPYAGLDARPIDIDRCCRGRL